MSPNRRRVLAAIAISLVGVVLTGQLLTTTGPDLENLVFVGGIALLYTALGALVLLSAPRQPVGRLMVAAGLVAGVQLVAMSWTSSRPLAWLAQWLWWPMLALVLGALLVFPTGSLPSPRWRVLGWLIVLSTVVTSLLLAVAATGQPQLFAAYRIARPEWVDRLLDLVRLVALVEGVGFLVIIVSLLVRWRASTPGSDERLQLACLVPGGLLLLAGIGLSVPGVPGASLLIVGGVPLGMTVAILRYRLFDVDLIVNRTIVWLILTGVVIAAIAGLVALLSNVVFSLTGSAAAMVAAGAVVFAVEPLRRVLQRAVDRLIYGDRNDPYAVIARLGEVLGHTYDPSAVMPLVTETIGRSLQVPYVAVELTEGERHVTGAEYGRRVPHVESFDMVAHGECLGRLVVGRRTQEAPFTRKEVRLLQDVAVQAGVAAEATRLNRDLLALRDRLVADRERERLRLRRELHDGLGPGLAGMRLQVTAAARSTDRTRVDGILAGLVDDLDTISGDMRRIVDELRPPALDKGLAAAVQAECQRFDTSTDDGGLRIRWRVEGEDAGLPVAVEVAAFRIVSEALTNVARHAGARRCDVTVRCDRTLRIEVVDDGRGVSAPPGRHEDPRPGSPAGGSTPMPTRRFGVGMTSMRDRAAELGGSCVVEARPGGGTAVRVELPLRRATLGSAAPTAPMSTALADEPPPHHGARDEGSRPRRSVFR
ncbi:MAG: GAF domain-containing sensor histidine kinase [Phycicoccus sp.]